MHDPHIRIATITDLEAINHIYNHYVLCSTCTYQTDPETPDARAAWFSAQGPEHPIIVAELDRRVIGWGSLSPFHARAAFRHSVENSVYVDPSHHRRGVGRRLLTNLIERADALGHHAVIAAIDGEQAGSIALHAGLGFVTVGRLCEVGFKFGRWLDLIYLERRVPCPDPPSQHGLPARVASMREQTG